MKAKLSKGLCHCCNRRKKIFFQDDEDEGEKGTEALINWCRPCSTKHWFPTFRQNLLKGRKRREKERKIRERKARKARKLREKEEAERRERLQKLMAEHAKERRIRQQKMEDRARKKVSHAEGNIPLTKRLLAQGRDEDFIFEKFRERYEAEGKTDEGWIWSRVRTYIRIARKGE